MTLPEYQTSCGATDICMHTLERYFSLPGSMEITDSIAEALLRTVMKQAKILMKEPDNYEARAEIMWAGSLSHNGLTGCGSDGGDWACHRLEHELGGLYDVAHGAGLAAIWGTWARYVYDAKPERFAQLATNVLGVTPKETVEATALAGIEAMEQFFRDIKMPVNLRELGVNPTDEEYKLLAEKCFKTTGPLGSMKKLMTEDMEKIYRAAL
jgi:alcohol dehydrogenase YqhD (iron-dependent ADH family)